MGAGMSRKMGKLIVSTGLEERKEKNEEMEVMNVDEESDEVSSSLSLMSTQSAHEDWRYRLFDTARYGTIFKRHHLIPKLQMCERDDESVVAWISQESAPERGGAAWGIWFGDDFYENHHPNGHFRTSVDEHAELLAEATAAFGALSILERETREAKREKVTITHFIIVTACGALLDFICGYTPLRGSVQLQESCHKLSDLVERLEKRRIDVTFHEDALVANDKAKVKAQLGLLRFLENSYFVSTSKAVATVSESFVGAED